MKKIKEFIDKSRIAFLAAVKHVDELPKPKQSRALQIITIALKQVDILEDIISSEKKTNKRIPANEKLLMRIWEEMNTPSTDYKLMVVRLKPIEIDGLKTGGYLKTFYLPITIPDIIEKIGEEYGGGKYQIKIVDEEGKFIKSKSFEISGYPKSPSIN